MTENGDIPGEPTRMATTQTAPHVPPQNLEAEESVLGAMMISQPAREKVVLDVRLRPEDFYREQHRKIFAAIERLETDGEPVDNLTVSERLAQGGELEAAGGKDLVASLVATAPAPGNAKHYAEIVQKNALLRRLIAAAQTIEQSAHDRGGEPSELVEHAEALLFKVAHDERASDFREIGSILEDELEKLEQLSKGDTTIVGTPSGFRDLDDVTGGFRPGNLIVFAARPAMGKSALVCNIAENVAVGHSKPVAFFSLEMSEAELAHRFIASQARISSDKLRKGQVASRDWSGVVRACNALDKAPLWIDDSSDLGLLELRAKTRRLHAQEISNGNGGLSVVIVDYIQLMRAEDPRSNRVEQVAQMSRGLKILARELDVPVIAISQLSRAPEQRPDKRPILSDLRESGAIEQDSDVVGFLFRDEYYTKDESQEPGVAELIVAKHRNGPVRTIKMAFISHYPKFADMARGERPVEQPAGEGPPMLGDQGQGSSGNGGGLDPSHGDDEPGDLDDGLDASDGEF